jgi:hypothetical protein
VASNSSSTSGKGAAIKPIVWMNFIRRLADWSTGEKCLLYTVGLHADKDTGEAYPSIKTLMDEAALGKTFTIQTLKKAINCRLLRERRKGYGDQRYWQRTYTLTIPAEDEILGSLTEPTIGELGSLTEQLGSLSESAKISQNQTQSVLEADFSGAIRSLSDHYQIFYQNIYPPPLLLHLTHSLRPTKTISHRPKTQGELHPRE